MSRNETTTLECDRCHVKLDINTRKLARALTREGLPIDDTLGWARIIYERYVSGRDVDPTVTDETTVAQVTLDGHVCPNCAPLVLAMIEGR